MSEANDDFVTIKYTQSTIAEVLDRINADGDGGIFLPYIQRDFVWREERIYSLLDSLMRGYPIGTILAWETKRPINYRGFECDYDVNNNSELQAGDENNLTLKQYILDGQQRLQSLYIAMRGSYNGNILFLNLKSKPKDELDEKYIFKFKPATFNQCKNYWLNVREFLSKPFTADFNIVDELRQEGIISKSNSDKDNETILQNAQRLHNIFMIECNISIQKLTNTSLIDIAEIFARANIGGITLKLEELTMSMIKSRWVASSKKFGQLIEKIQKLGFDKPKEFILQACDTILTVLTLREKEKNKTKKKIDGAALKLALEQDFTKISISIISVLQFVSKIDAICKFRYTYHNPIFIIIAYYYSHCIQDRNVWREHESAVRTFLLVFLLCKDCRRLNKDIIKGLLEYIISDNGKDFSLDEIKSRFWEHGQKRFELNIDALLSIRMDSTIAPLVLYFIYYKQDRFYSDTMTVRDHIFPKSALNGIYKDALVNSILNCELLTKKDNAYSQDGKGNTLPCDFFYNSRFLRLKKKLKIL